MAHQARTFLQVCRRTSICTARCRNQVVSGIRWSSVDSPAPPLLAKIKGDLKAAMKNKDTARLNVLRAIITEANNAVKNNTPVKNDLQVLSMLRKRKTSSQTAQKEANEQKREDIAAKEQSEIDVIEEYAGTVKMMNEEEIKSTISAIVEQMKAETAGVKASQILKEIFKAGGLLDGKPAERSQVVKIVGDLLGRKA